MMVCINYPTIYYRGNFGPEIKYREKSKIG